MANKTNNSRNEGKRPNRNTEENVRKERSTKGNMQNATFKQDQGKSMDENVQKRGYYSRNGSYSGYRGL